MSFVTGCGEKQTGPVVITETRPVPSAGPAVSTNIMSAAERLLPRMPAALPPDHPPVGDGAAGAVASALPGEAGTASSLAWDVPAGWTVGPTKPMRVVTFNSGAVECAITELGGGGGGAEANINRWRGQFGQSPLAAGELATLPTIRMLGQDVPLVEAEGTYVGMGTTEQAGSKLLGTLAADGERMIFVKMTGPAAEVEAQRGAFIALCGSLRVRE